MSVYFPNKNRRNSIYSSQWYDRIAKWQANIQAMPETISAADHQVRVPVADEAKQIIIDTVLAELTLSKELIEMKCQVHESSDGKTITISMDPFGYPISFYQHSQVWRNGKKQGFAVQTHHNGTAQHFPHAFIVPTHSRVCGNFTRLGRVFGIAQRVKESRYPITCIRGTAPATVMEEKLPQIAAQVKDLYVKKLTEAIATI
jgi:hypothetical protein